MTGETEVAGYIEKCTGCNLSVEECSFLQRSGNPAELATGSREYSLDFLDSGDTPSSCTWSGTGSCADGFLQ